jgi:MFS transporter, CP family, cyanate transporter
VHTTGRRKKLGGWVLVLATALIAINLRPGASSIGPVLEEISAGLGTGSGVAGVLTGLPGLCFGVVGAAAVGFARRVGLTMGIAMGIALAALCLILRGLADVPWLFLTLSALALAGMAVGNVLVPAWIKAHASTDNVLLPTIYGTGLIVGGTLGSALTAPVAAEAGWSKALAMWGVLALVAVPIWAWLAFRERSLTPTEAPDVADPTLRIFRSRTALAMATLFGVQSMHAYVQFGWLPQIYRDAGLSASSAGAMQAMLTAFGIVGALLMPTVIARSPNLMPWMGAFGVALFAGYLGLLLVPATLPWVWALLLGFSGFAFPTTIAMLTARTRDHAITARLSGFVQPAGYLLAAVGPFLVGLLHAATDSWTVPIMLLMATVVPFTWAGLLVSRPVYVDDELAVRG